jgi:tripeptide aminopeptidase
MISFTIDTIGVRPANSAQTEALSIVLAAEAAAKQLGVESWSLNTSSTDSNIPMSLGIPAITIGGGGTDANSHALSERYDDGPSGLGPHGLH